MRLAFAGLLLVLGTASLARQDTPTDIPRGELPKTAACVVCTALGSAHGEEKPAAGVRFKGKSFYFCSAKEVATFKKEPESFLPPVLPRPAPAFSLKNLAGETVKLSDLKGKVVLVDYWATWCAPCVATMPEMQKLHEKYGAKGLTVLGVSIDEEGEKKVKPFIAKRKFSYPILLDDQNIWKGYNIKAIPALFLVDREGQIVKQWTGKPDKKDVEQAVTGLLK
jgi:peroxiredoxin/YHS domain-containing protein